VADQLCDACFGREILAKHGQAAAIGQCWVEGAAANYSHYESTASCGVARNYDCGGGDGRVLYSLGGADVRELRVQHGSNEPVARAAWTLGLRPSAMAKKIEQIMTPPLNHLTVRRSVVKVFDDRSIATATRAPSRALPPLR
jgi:hypothetical protein